MKYSLDAEQGLQPLNEYDLWVLPTIPWAVIPPLQKNTMFNDSKDSGVNSNSNQWALYREPVSLVTLLPRQLCLATRVHHGDKFPFFPLDVERLAQLAGRHHFVKLLFFWQFQHETCLFVDFMFPLGENVEPQLRQTERWKDEVESSWSLSYLCVFEETEQGWN